MEILGVEGVQTARVAQKKSGLPEGCRTNICPCCPRAIHSSPKSMASEKTPEPRAFPDVVNWAFRGFSLRSSRWVVQDRRFGAPAGRARFTQE